MTSNGHRAVRTLARNVSFEAHEEKTRPTLSAAEITREQRRISACWLVEQVRPNRGPTKGDPHSRPQCRTAGQRFLALGGASLWRFATFKSSL